MTTLIPHKHAEVIKAWAEGHEIQVKTPMYDWQWAHVPQWNPDFEYRVKPVPKPVYPTFCPNMLIMDDGYANAVLHNFVATGQLKTYVEKYGVDGLKGQ